MNTQFKALALVLGIAGFIGQNSAFAKDAAELSDEATKLETHAADKARKAAAEENESSTAINEGKQSTAAKYAKKQPRNNMLLTKFQSRLAK